MHVVVAAKGADAFAYAEQLTARLEEAGHTVLLDDRTKVSPGVKFKDFELIGIPTAVVVGRGLTEGLLELKDRATGETREVSVDEVVAAVSAVVAADSEA